MFTRSSSSSGPFGKGKNQHVTLILNNKKIRFIKAKVLARSPSSISVSVMWVRLNQLPYKTEDLVQRMLKGIPTDRISAQDSLQHPYFSTLPPPIMHLRDSKTSSKPEYLKPTDPTSSFSSSVFQRCPFSRCPVSDWRQRSETSSIPDGGSRPPYCPPPSAGEQTLRPTAIKPSNHHQPDETTKGTNMKLKLKQNVSY